MKINEISKYIALILRHKPEEIGIVLDEHGWANVDDLINGINKTTPFTFEMLEEIITENGNTPEMIYKKMCKIKTCMESIDMLITNSFYLEAALEYINSKMQE